MAGISQSLFFFTSPSSQWLSSRNSRPSFQPIYSPNSSRSLSSSRTTSSTSIPVTIRACNRPHQVNGSGSGAAKDSSSPTGLNWGKPVLNFVDNNFLPLALIGGVAVGLANPTFGCLADKYSLSKVSTVGIFFISGLTLRNGEIGAAVKAWLVGVFGLCSVLLFTPYISKIILQVQLQPQEFVTGFAVGTFKGSR